MPTQCLPLASVKNRPVMKIPTVTSPVSGMEPCPDCDQSGFSDKVHREFFAMEPADKLCGFCNGRGWRLPNPPTPEAGAAGGGYDPFNP